MATVSLEQAVNSHGPDPLHAATGKEPHPRQRSFRRPTRFYGPV